MNPTGWGRINCYESLFVLPQPAITVESYEFSEITDNGDATGQLNPEDTVRLVVT